MNAVAGKAHLEAAAGWFLLLAEDSSAQTRARWQQWHDAAAEHRLAWQKVERLQALLAGAPEGTRKVLAPEPHPRRRRLLATLGVIVAAGGAWALLPAGPSAVPVQWVATARGERRTVALPDGGRIVLGSDTRVGIAYGAQARDIHVTRGMLQLASARDSRPLRIVARDGVVVPLGTRFTMSVFHSRTELAVQEHAVEITTSSGARVRVAAGQRVTFDGKGCGEPRAAATGEDAWTRGLLMALDTPLPAFAARFALQSGQSVDVAPALADRAVSGTFQLDAPERSLRTLADVLAIRLERRGDGWRLAPR